MAESGKITLYSYWLSSCSQRVRIALNLKGLDYEYKAVKFLEGGQFDPEFEKINPVKFVPALVDGDLVLADSFAIILYLEDKYPQHPLLPQDLKKESTQHPGIASIVGSTIQPLQNHCVLKSIEDKLKSDVKLAWAQQHINRGFAAIEKLLEATSGKYATGDAFQLADVFLAPQLYAAISRFQIDMRHVLKRFGGNHYGLLAVGVHRHLLSPYPTLARLNQAYTEHPAFQATLPAWQPDAPLQS